MRGSRLGIVLTGQLSQSVVGDDFMKLLRLLGPLCCQRTPTPYWLGSFVGQKIPPTKSAILVFPHGWFRLHIVIFHLTNTQSTKNDENRCIQLQIRSPERPWGTKDPKRTKKTKNSKITFLTFFTFVIFVIFHLTNWAGAAIARREKKQDWLPGRVHSPSLCNWRGPYVRYSRRVPC